MLLLTRWYCGCDNEVDQGEELWVCKTPICGQLQSPTECMVGSMMRSMVSTPLDCIACCCVSVFVGVHVIVVLLSVMLGTGCGRIGD